MTQPVRMVISLVGRFPDLKTTFHPAIGDTQHVHIRNGGSARDTSQTFPNAPMRRITTLLKSNMVPG